MFDIFTRFDALLTSQVILYRIWFVIVNSDYAALITMNVSSNLSGAGRRRKLDAKEIVSVTYF